MFTSVRKLIFQWSSHSSTVPAAVLQYLICWSLPVFNRCCIFYLPFLWSRQVLNRLKVLASLPHCHLALICYLFHLGHCGYIALNLQILVIECHIFHVSPPLQWEWSLMYLFHSCSSFFLLWLFLYWKALFSFMLLLLYFMHIRCICILQHFDQCSFYIQPFIAWN